MNASGCEGLWYHIENNCERMATCEHHDWLKQDGGTPADCVPSKNTDAIADSCGVFVTTSGDDASRGAKEEPVKTLAAAIAQAEKNQTRRVYACAETFEEEVKITGSVTIYGGLDCKAAWLWSAEARSTIEAPADKVALTLTAGASGSAIENFAVRAANATLPGGSSIAVAVADVEAELARVEVTAGDGMDGENGTTPTEASTVGAAAPATMSNACIATNAVVGGAPGVTMCEDGETRGGIGGLGGITGTESGNGLPGESGAPLPDPNPEEYGLGGRGQTDPVGNCRRGEDGTSGGAGTPGIADSSATLTLAGISGGDGANGTTGKRGQGGGGGGGAKAGVFCSAGIGLIDGVGASGGGGGAGGCGGKGGGGGKAGGSSLGILSVGTRLKLTEVTVTVGKAGKGGDGALGKTGATGGAGATGGDGSGLGESIPGCKGGDGGRGGLGGSGAGGRGGYAVGLAYATAPSAAPALAGFTPGTAGTGGNAGPGGPPESAGAPGGAGTCWNFSAQIACGQ